MVLRIFVGLLAAFSLTISSHARTECVDASRFTNGTMNIVKRIESAENSADGVYGFAGTGWFLSDRIIVTAAHVSEAMELGAEKWSRVEIRSEAGTRPVEIRLIRIEGESREKLALLETRTAIAGIMPLAVRSEPLAANEPVSSVGYPGGTLRTAAGRFVRSDAEETFAGALLLELHDGDDRLAVDHGSSGAPVLDCQGRVVAVITNVLSQTLKFHSRAIRISTAWQTPNVVSVSAAPLIAGRYNE